MFHRSGKNPMADLFDAPVAAEAATGALPPAPEGVETAMSRLMGMIELPGGASLDLMPLHLPPCQAQS